MDRRARLNSNEVPVPFLLKLEVEEGGIIRHTKTVIQPASVVKRSHAHTTLFHPQDSNLVHYAYLIG